MGRLSDSLSSNRTQTLMALSIFTILGLVGWRLYSAATQMSAGPRLDPSNVETVALGEEIYLQVCAACHGLRLEGQPNWQRRFDDGRLPAPPHDETGHTWHHPDGVLFELTKYGVAAYLDDPSYETDMPVFDEVLSDEEIVSALSFIKSRWPKKVQARHNEINDRTRP